MHKIFNTNENYNGKLKQGIRDACRADKRRYWHDGRADKRRYWHDRRADSQCQTVRHIINVDDKKNWPKDRPLGTPDVTFFQPEHLPLNTALCFLSLKKSSIHFNKFSYCRRQVALFYALTFVFFVLILV